MTITTTTQHASPLQLISFYLFRVLNHLRCQFIFYDFPIFIVVLVIEYILNDAVAIDPRTKTTIALFNLEHDEG